MFVPPLQYIVYFSSLNLSSNRFVNYPWYLLNYSASIIQKPNFLIRLIGCQLYYSYLKIQAGQTLDIQCQYHQTSIGSNQFRTQQFNHSLFQNQYLLAFDFFKKCLTTILTDHFRTQFSLVFLIFFGFLGVVLAEIDWFQFICHMFIRHCNLFLSIFIYLLQFFQSTTHHLVDLFFYYYQFNFVLFFIILNVVF